MGVTGDPNHPVAQDFRKLAQAVDPRIILVRAHRQASQAIVILYGRSVSSMTHTETPVTLLKITGLGRSGSTILDVVLGNHPQIESVGEVMNLIRTGWVSQESLRGIDQKRLRRPLCTCGKRLDVLYVDTPEEACPFWSSVRREWVERADRDSIESYRNFRRLSSLSDDGAVTD